jgi:CRISPR-associated protein Csh2
MEKKAVEAKDLVTSHYHGIFVTETILGNPNGSFTGNEPRNIEGRVYTTDKCIKYNIRMYISSTKERIVKDANGRVTAVDDFVFFFPRKTADASEGESSFLTKESVFTTYLENDRKKVLQCPDVRMFGGTFSFRARPTKPSAKPVKPAKQPAMQTGAPLAAPSTQPAATTEEGEGSESFNIHGPIQISYGLDIIGASIINHQVGTPFANKDGDQKTIGESSIVDHAVIAYDIEINPNSYKGLLTKRDLELFKEAIVGGTDMRRSTSKHTVPKLLLMLEFPAGHPNIGELKQYIQVTSKKITDFTPGSTPNMKLDLGTIKKRLEQLGYKNVASTTWKDPNVDLENWP